MENGIRARTRLVSILGLGPKDEPAPYYTPVSYELQGRLSSKTPVLASALVELIGADEVVLLGTSAVEERWVKSGELAKHLGADHRFERIADGRKDEEVWAVFEAWRTQLSGEGAPPAVLLVDLTHGWGVQRLLGLAALASVQAQWHREGQRAPQVRVFYGAFDDCPSDAGGRPIWDLSEVLAMSRYDAAIDALVRYGRGDDLAELCRADASAAVSRARDEGHQGRALGTFAHLRPLGEGAKRLADDLALGRAHDVVTKSGPDLRNRLADAATVDWVSKRPVLRGATEHLERWVRDLCGTTLVGSEGARAMLRLARQYQRTERFAEHAAALREGLITLAAAQLGLVLVDPGQPGFSERRRLAEARLRELTHRWTNKNDREILRRHLAPDLLACVELAAAVQSLRNDIEHLGLNDSPGSSAGLRAQLEERTEAYARLIGDPSGGPAAVADVAAPPRPFLNLSNHPTTTWPPAQRDAARALGFADAIDLEGGFPLLGVELDEAEIVEIASDLAARAIAQGAAAALVATDYTLTFALVTELQARGVRCFSAVTYRAAAETLHPDGTVKREADEFLRFREYARPVAPGA